MKKLLFLAITILWATAVFAAEEVSSSGKGSFEAGKGVFLLNGEPYHIKAAELHYPRIPRLYWDHRIKMCKALGMNTVCLYVFWNTHEPQPGEFDFTGQNDLREFVKLCQQNGMNVILRPGPYVCAEWEMGGLPWWLLKDKDIRLREDDPRFLKHVDLFQQAVAEQVGGLTIENGGPIIMIQVENEYGSYGVNKPYVAAIRDMLRKNFGENVTLFQCDWASNFTDNGLEDLVWTMNFGTGADIDQQFARLRELRPDSPLMCSEFWSGWFDKWGGEHETRSADAMIAGLEEMMSEGISFSLYMTHGGTNWGHWAGANSPGYAPDVTSYDYDAPIDEAGNPTPKYHALRRMFARYDKNQTKIPPVIKPISIATFALTEVAPLFANLPEEKLCEQIHSMEEFDQGFGSILYRTTLPRLTKGSTLTVDEPHDYAQIFINGLYAGKLDRRLGEKEITLPDVDSGSTLDILVEATGRINFGRAIKDFKGITDRVSVTTEIDGYPFVCDLRNWKIFNLPDEEDFYCRGEYVPVDAFTPGDDGRLPRGVYRGTFNVDKPSDTFLDMSGWGKGLLYVNGHPMGRFWEIGPQQTLYMPGCWLKQGENSIMVFDILGPRRAAIEGRKHPVLDDLRLERPQRMNASDVTLDLTATPPALSTALTKENGWKELHFDNVATGRYVTLEFTPTEGEENIALAEIHITDPEGNNFPREGWNAIYADSEEETGNHTTDKLFDLQESTYWITKGDEVSPCHIVIDMGLQQNPAGIRLLPRMESGSPGSPGHVNVYITPGIPFETH
ncbi:MAG: beta-galactosidase [Bacteroidales bacterium]|nr:beta-galactosidase [Bacteroidales bacterium]